MNKMSKDITSFTLLTSNNCSELNPRNTTLSTVCAMCECLAFVFQSRIYVRSFSSFEREGDEKEKRVIHKLTSHRLRLVQAQPAIDTHLLIRHPFDNLVNGFGPHNALLVFSRVHYLYE